MGQQLSGEGTLDSYSSTIYRKAFGSVDTINLIKALNATFGILSTPNAVWTVDRFSRNTKSYGVGIGIAFLAFLGQ
ncbi:6d229750-8287-4d35-9876-b05a135bf937 [Thermothielavioides terrestris]|nr:6d229750-8287-4d35-9876-b05a135bf937 [Thermothielavioides terrestris]